MCTVEATCIHSTTHMQLLTYYFLCMIVRFVPELAYTTVVLSRSASVLIPHNTHCSAMCSALVFFFFFLEQCLLLRYHGHCVFSTSNTFSQVFLLPWIVIGIYFFCGCQAAVKFFFTSQMGSYYPLLSSKSRYVCIPCLADYKIILSFGIA